MFGLKDKKLFYVGGAVRDEILGVQNFDTDLCYEGDAINFAENNHLNIIKHNPDFGTVRVLCNGKEIDIASTREEIYPRKGHLPKVRNIGCSLKEDVKRRDFTINTMAKNTVTGEIVDYFDGQSDLKDRKLKVLHDNSFIDDPTRIIRGLKFSVRLGVELDDHTYDLQKGYLEKINYDMSYHRVKKELIETFNLNRAEAFDRFVEQGIYKILGDNQIVPDIKGKDIKSEIKKHGLESNIWLIYMCFFDLSKLSLTKSEKKIIEYAKSPTRATSANNMPPESIVIRNIYSQ